MAIYHCSLQNISRADGRSAIAAAAYRSTSKLVDRTTGETCDYTRKNKALATGIELPDGAPRWAKKREELWNRVEEKENRKNSILAYEINVAIPCELSRNDQIKLMKDYCKTITDTGLACDWAIHAPNKKGDERNVHGHIMFTTRTFEAGDWSKNKLHWSNKTKPDGTNEARDRVEKHRKDWEKCANAALLELHRDQQFDINMARKKQYDENGYWSLSTEKAPEKIQIDSRTLVAQREDLLKKAKVSERQGNVEKAEKQQQQAAALDREPQQHMGVIATAMERRGLKSDRGRFRKAVEFVSEKLLEIKREIEKHLAALGILEKQETAAKTRSQQMAAPAAQPQPEAVRPPLATSAAQPQPQPVRQHAPPPPPEPKKPEKQETAEERRRRWYEEDQLQKKREAEARGEKYQREEYDEEYYKAMEKNQPYVKPVEPERRTITPKERGGKPRPPFSQKEFDLTGMNQAQIFAAHLEQKRRREAAMTPEQRAAERKPQQDRSRGQGR